MTFKLRRFSELLCDCGPERIEINTLEELCDLCKSENHKLIFDARDNTTIVWDAIFFYHGVDDLDFFN